MRVSAVVITRNEQANIARCLESLRFCDEVIVLDCFSTDRTVEIAKRYTSQVHQMEWKGYVAQKNAAVGLAQGDWILSLDADEEVSPALRHEIEVVLASDPRESAFSMPRKTIHLGRWIRYGGWYPNRLVRLFRRQSGTWVGVELHERWESTGDVGRLNSDLLHYSFSNLEDQITRNNLYSSLGARQLKVHGKQFSFFRLMAKSGSKFCETYLLKRGFLDGYPGFIIAVSAAYSVFLKWAKLWELEHVGPENKA